MATARLIGRLGGPPEVVETAIDSISIGSHSVTLPTGWGSGWCVFQGATSRRISNVTLFGRETRTDSTSEYLRSSTAIGGGCSSRRVNPRRSAPTLRARSLGFACPDTRAVV